MSKNTKNRGFSLVELIVTISVITVLSGALIPQFVKYANSRRQQACRANREALLNIYEKAVYDDQLLITQEDLQMVLNASGTKMTTEYTNQAKDYLICPSAKETGHYTARVGADKTVYVICDEHKDDICALNFDNWVGKAALVIDEDPVIPVPAGAGGGEGGEGVSDPEEDEVPPVDTTETVNTGIWPRPMDAQGRIDERWAAVGLKPGNSVTITGPLHFIDTTGIEIVVTTSGAFQVKYEDAASPLGKGSNAIAGVVAASGLVYSVENEPAKYTHFDEGHYEDVPVVNKYTVQNTGEWKTREVINKKERDVWYYYTFDCGDKNCSKRGIKRKFYSTNGKENNEVVQKGEEHQHNDPKETTPVWVDGPSVDAYRISYGDMFVLNGITYIYTINTGDEACVSLPTADQTSYGVSYNGWYRVPALQD